MKKLRLAKCKKLQIFYNKFKYYKYLYQSSGTQLKVQGEVSPGDWESRGIFRTQSNIYDVALLRKQLTTFSQKFFSQKAPSQMFDQILNTPLEDSLSNRHLKPIMPQSTENVFPLYIHIPLLMYCQFSLQIVLYL